METILFTLVVINLIALISAALLYVGTIIQKQLDEKRLIFHWKKVFIQLITIVITVFIVYSVVGLITEDEYIKPNGNVCRGYRYGIHICSGDINAE